MTTFARLVAFFLGVAVAACAWLPWVREVDGWHLSLRTLLSPESREAAHWNTSLGLAVTLAALVIIFGSLFNSRTLVIVGGLLSVAFPTIWILSNAISTGSGGVPMTQIKLGAYGAAVLGFMALILAAVARDTRIPTTR